MFKVASVIGGQLVGKFAKISESALRFHDNFPDTSYEVEYFEDEKCTIPYIENEVHSAGLIMPSWLNFNKS